MKQYTEYRDSGVEWIGEIPNEWEVKKNRYILTRVKNIVGDDELKYPVLSLSVKGVIEKDRDDNSGKIPVVYADYYQVIQSGNLLLCLFDMDVTPCLVGFIEKTGIISPAYSYFEPFKKGSICPKYYYYWYLRMHIENLFIKLSNNVRSSINNENFKNIVAPFPPLPVQQVIADYLDQKTSAIDTLISDKQKLVDLLKEKRQTIISEAVTKGLDKTVKMKGSGIDWIGEIPMGWEIKKLRYLGYCQNGLSKAGEYFGSGYPFVSYGDVYKNYELPQEVAGLVESTEVERETCSVKRGDVFFTRTSETIEEVALTSTCLTTIENATFAGFLIRFRPYTQNKIAPEFSKYFFRSQMHRAYFVKEMNLVTRASLGQELLKNLPVVLPPIEEQQVIADYLDKKTTAIDYLITDITLQIEKLKEYRQSIISEAVTGKVAI